MAKKGKKKLKKVDPITQQLNEIKAELKKAGIDTHNFLSQKNISTKSRNKANVKKISNLHTQIKSGSLDLRMLNSNFRNKPPKTTKKTKKKPTNNPPKPKTPKTPKPTNNPPIPKPTDTPKIPKPKPENPPVVDWGEPDDNEDDDFDDVVIDISYKNIDAVFGILEQQIEESQHTYIQNVLGIDVPTYFLNVFTSTVEQAKANGTLRDVDEYYGEYLQHIDDLVAYIYYSSDRNTGYLADAVTDLLLILRMGEVPTLSEVKSLSSATKYDFMSLNGVSNYESEEE